MPKSHEPSRLTADTTVPATAKAAAASRRLVRERARLGGEQKAEGRSPRALAVSVVLHGVVALVLMQITFGHGLAGFLGLDRFREKPEERLTYVAPTPKAPVVPTAAATPKRTPRVPRPQPADAPPVVGPVVVEPTAPVPVTAPPTEARADTGSGAGVGSGAAGVGTLDPNLRGVAPGYTDSRIWRGSAGGGAATAGQPSLRNGADRLDSIIAYSITSAADSLEAAARAEGRFGRKPGDWTKTGKNGDKWGWDNAGIRLGKVVIPNALLTLLPLNVQGAMSGNSTAIDRERRLSASRNDIIRSANLALGDAQFKKLASELRDRREKERRDRLRAPSAAIVATKPINKP